MSRSQKIVILGAGLVGLSLAWYLEKLSPLPLEITLIEQSSRVGGKIQTDQVEGALFERGPHTLRLSPPFRSHFESLIKQLDLEKEVLLPSEGVKKRFIAYQNNLHPFPPPPSQLFLPRNFSQLVWPLLKQGLKKRLPQEDPSIHEVMTHYFGPYIRDTFIDPMVAGILGGDIKKLSLKACFPLIEELQNKKGPLLFHLLKTKQKNPSRIISFKKGIQTLPLALYEQLSSKVLLDTKALCIKWSPSLQLQTSQGLIECDHLFSTLPASPLYSLLKNTSLSSLSFLKEIPHLGYKILHLGFDEELPLEPAFGYLTLPSSQDKTSGVIFSSALFPSQNSTTFKTRLTVMVSECSSLYAAEDSTLIKNSLLELEKYLKCSLKPRYLKIHTLENALAQYEVGHLDKLKTFEEGLKKKCPHFTLLGSSFYGSSVPKCIEQARVAATQFCTQKFTV